MKYDQWNELEMAEQICSIGRRLYQHFLVAGNGGNISVRLNEDEVLITPTNVSKGFMQPDHLCKISLEGVTIRSSGGHKPSSEARMHTAIYRELPQVRAIVHAHPPVATGFAVAGVSIDRPFLPEIVVKVGKIGLVPYATPGGDELPNSIIPYLKDHGVLLLGNHGVVAWAENLTEAMFKTETIELTARVLQTAMQVGVPRFLTEAEVVELQSRYQAPLE